MALKYPYDKIFALCENMKERIRNNGGNSPINIVPIGVDIEKFTPSKEKETEEPLFLYVGRFKPEKGYKLFIESAEKLEQEKFLMVGDDPEKLGKTPQNLEVRGKVPHGEMVNIYNEATCLVLPSYTEGLPRVCLEALACGTPVIGSKVGGVPELVLDGETGFTIEPGNLKQLVNKIETVRKNPELISKMGQQGRKHIVENYDESKTMKKTVKELEMVAGDH
ncbi:hypothetical protein AKJ56_01580 [candidate division MSBL1 archaeon SCGC-AAA382N08]|uniref:Glycosyl transferase family 1 domain-containing protein n=1 Tax=candidate division MSBL1 archaeon SCGC-AAA382N08 TaxID=1698285 RepID=A0A133VPH7_9EURY|nr:hypothetical protein AKJ56_01580 [candidate division MSBL1 archaeon SCGC-AAA382N08]